MVKLKLHYNELRTGMNEIEITFYMHFGETYLRNGPATEQISNITQEN